MPDATPCAALRPLTRTSEHGHHLHVEKIIFRPAHLPDRVQGPAPQSARAHQIPSRDPSGFGRETSKSRLMPSPSLCSHPAPILRQKLSFPSLPSKTCKRAIRAAILRWWRWQSRCGAVARDCRSERGAQHSRAAGKGFGSERDWRHNDPTKSPHRGGWISGVIRKSRKWGSATTLTGS
jgi:hypothetical protein